MSLPGALRSLSLLAILAGASASAWALPQPQGRGPEQQQRGSQARQHDRRDDKSALSDAVRRAERATGGQVLSAERVPFDGRAVNRVKVVDDRGRVRVYWDDPQAQRAQDVKDAAPRTRRTRDDDDDSD